MLSNHLMVLNAGFKEVIKQLYIFWKVDFEFETEFVKSVIDIEPNQCNYLFL